MASKKENSFPRLSIDRGIKLTRAIFDKNAGKECTTKEAASFCGQEYNSTFRTELVSAELYGLIDRPQQGKVIPSEIAKKIVRPQGQDDLMDGYREALFKTPIFYDVYESYRGEYLPDEPFLSNALRDKFKVEDDKKDDFIKYFIELLNLAKLAESKDGKIKLIDISIRDDSSTVKKQDRITKLGKEVKIKDDDSCFVMMPFAAPIGNYYKIIYEPAIIKSGLKPIRADSEIFGTGKIIDQIWSGINSSKILLAELTTRNANVFYELGLAHALNKPVVLISSNENDVPFDLHHIRVIYYDMQDPFWGQKLIDKIAENILSALANPAEAIFKPSDI